MKAIVLSGAILLTLANPSLAHKGSTNEKLEHAKIKLVKKNKAEKVQEDATLTTNNKITGKVAKIGYEGTGQQRSLFSRHIALNKKNDEKSKLKLSAANAKKAIAQNNIHTVEELIKAAEQGDAQA